MPLFAYKGVDANSKTVSGTIDAESDRAARAKLRRLRIYPTKISESGTVGGKQRRFFQRVKVEDVAGMSRQMAVLLNAGIPLVDSLQATTEQTENPTVRKTMSEIKEKVEEGARLADCMVNYPKVFDPIFIHMVRAGEASGQLDTVFLRLADYKEAQADLKAKVKSALMYPVIMMIVALCMLAFLFTQVVPKIVVALEKQKAAIPTLTRIVMGITYLVQNYWYLLLIVAAVIYFFMRSWKNSPKGRRKLDDWALSLPIFGELNLKIAVARFARTLSTLLSSGVQLLPGLDIVKNVMDNKILEEIVTSVMMSVKEGESLAEPLKRSHKFPPMFLHMVSVGEKTGQLEAMLEKVADNYDKEVDNFVKGLTSILTPVLLLVLGGAIALVVFSVLLPIFQMTAG